MKKFILISILFLLHTFLRSQSPFLRQTSFSEGLPTNNIYSVFQDSKGFLWLSTDVGVCRYNGYEFNHYTTDDGLVDTEIFNCYEDKNGRIWFRTLNGKVSYYKNGEFRNSLNDSTLEQINFNSSINAIIEYDHKIYFSSMSGKVYELDSNNTTQIISLDSSFSYGIYFYENELLMLTSHAILIYDVKRFNLQKTIPIDVPKSYMRSAQLNNYLFLSNKNQLTLFDLKNKSFHPMENFESEIISICPIDSLIWIGTRNGVHSIYLNKKTNTNLTSSFLQNQAVTSTCKDFEGGFWYSTLDDGLFYTSDTRIKSLFQLPPKKEIGFISSIEIAPNNDVWIGLSKNAYFHGMLPKIKMDLLSQTKEDAIKRIRFFENSAWVMSGRTIKKINPLNNNQLYLSYSANDIISDGKDYLIAANSLVRVPKNKFNGLLSPVEKKRITISDTHLIYEKRVNVLHKNSEQKILVGASEGLFLLKSDSLIEITYNNMPLGAISDFCEDTKGNIIVTTLDNGSYQLSNKKIVAKIGANQNLNSSNCLKCEVDQEDNLWILTSKGLNHIVFENGEINITDASSIMGLKKEKITGLTFYKDQLLITTPTNILSFNNHTPIDAHPKINLTSVIVNNQVTNHSNLTLAPNKNNISISYTGISFKNSDGLLYEYQLVGSSNSWTKTKNRTIQFESLPSGEYIFQVKAINEFGNESEIIQVSFTIKKPYYKKWWFFLLILIFFFFLIHIIWKLRVKALTKKHQIEQKIIIATKEKAELESELKEIEQQALRLQMNPHFIFNALNTIKGYYTSENISKADAYIAKFSRLLRIILEHKESTISLSKEKEMLELYLHLVMLRYDTNFSFKFKIGEGINPDEVIIPSMLLQPFIENSIIHGIATILKNGKLEVIFQKSGSSLQCTIRDNGIGRKASREKSQEKNNRINAIDITKRRLDLIEQESGGKTEIIINDLYENDVATGTEVILTLPYQEKW